MEEQLLAFAAKALNISQEEVKETLTDEENGGLETLLQKDAARIKETKDAGYKSAERKVNTTWEQSLKNEFGLQSDAKGTELLAALKETVATKAPAEPKEITEAQLKKHPYVLNLEKQVQEVKQTVIDEYELKFAQIKEATEQEKLLSGVKQNALSIFKAMGTAILPPDPKKADLQVNELFLKKLENYKYQKDGDSYILLDPESGERINNTHGYAMKFEDMVKDIASSTFDFQAVEQRSSSARNTDEQTTTSATVPKNKAEYIKLLSDDSIPAEDKMKAVEAYESAN